MKKTIAIFLVLAMATVANAELTLTISGPSTITVGGTATYSVSYSGVPLRAWDIDIVVDDELKGVIAGIEGVPPCEICPIFIFGEVIPISRGFEVTLTDDMSNNPLPSNMFTFDLTATGTAGQVINVSMFENSFFDLYWNSVEGVMPSKAVTIVSGNCIVPNEVNVPLADANAAIIAAGFTVGTITYQSDNNIPAGTVISTTPAGGVTADCGSAVAIVASTGPCFYVGRVFSGPGFTTFTVTQAMVDRWNAVCRPNCWCCLAQKRGNGVYTGSSATKTDLVDLACVKNPANYNKSTTCANACCDFNMSGKIDSVDLAVVKNALNYNKSTGSGPPCN